MSATDVNPNGSKYSMSFIFHSSAEFEKIAIVMRHDATMVSLFKSTHKRREPLHYYHNSCPGQCSSFPNPRHCQWCPSRHCYFNYKFYQLECSDIDETPTTALVVLQNIYRGFAVSEHLLTNTT
jgi:hypothetical protein